MAPLYSREEAVEFGISANEAEGLHVSDYFLDLSNRYISSEIDLAEFHDLLDIHYFGRKGISNAISRCLY